MRMDKDNDERSRDQVRNGVVLAQVEIVEALGANQRNDLKFDFLERPGL
jgi:hypothetical protein